MKRKVLGISAALAMSLHAEVFELGKIEVAGNGPEQGTVKNVINQDVMQQYNTKTLTDSVNLLSGATIQEGGGRNEQMIMIRGFDVKHAPLMIDGIPVAVPYDGYVDFSRFTTFDLSEIEVSKGVLTSVLYGPNTFAGTINMVTKRPTKEFEADAGIGAFTGNGWDGYLNLGSNQGKYYVMASLSGMQQDSFPLGSNFSGNMYQGSGARNNSYAKDTKVNLKVAYTPNATDEYAFNYIKQDADKGVPPFAAPFDSVITNNAYNAKTGVVNNANGGGIVHFWDWKYWDKESYYFLSKTQFDNFYIKARLSYDTFNNSLAMFTDPTYGVLSNGTNPSFYKDNTKAGSLESGIKTFDQDILKLALHYKLDTHNEGGIYNNVSGQATGAQAPVYTMQDQISSFAGEYKKPFANMFKATVGASYDLENMLKAQNTNYLSTSGVFTANAPIGTKGAVVLPSYTTTQNFPLGSSNAFNPMAKLEADLNQNSSMYIGIGQKSRLPSIKDRYSYKLGQFIPNSNLAAEKIIGYEVGGAQKIANGVVKSSLFYSNAYNFVQSQFVPVWYNTGSGTSAQSNQLQQLQNVGTVNQKGLELEGSYFVNEYLFLDGSYTRLLMQNVSNPSILITDVPNTKVMLSADITPINEVVWTNAFEYQSQMYSNFGQANVPGQSYTYYSSGITANWYTKIAYHPIKNASIELGVNNVLDRNYNFSYGYPAAGRVYFTNLRYKI